ncbi:hypothetical protein [Streptomyces sp. NBC_01594]|uniref:hypothetical protein n=1 Tax=Streptomyces sp. NBC_01594 TaxID=2975890 RepID=UPI00387096EC
MDADAALTFLVMMLVSWLPVGMAGGVLSLVMSVRAMPGVWGLWEAGIVAFYRWGPSV